LSLPLQAFLAFATWRRSRNIEVTLTTLRACSSASPRPSHSFRLLPKLNKSIIEVKLHSTSCLLLGFASSQPLVPFASKIEGDAPYRVLGRSLSLRSSSLPMQHSVLHASPPALPEPTPNAQNPCFPGLRPRKTRDSRPFVAPGRGAGLCLGIPFFVPSARRGIPRQRLKKELLKYI
jgi:hypothetical protein